MDEVDNPNFEELCRVCATKTIGLATNIFKNEGTTRQISKKICTCLPIQVDEMDELPKIICENCLYKLESFYDFRESSAQAERLLVEIHKKLNSTQAQKDQQQPSVVPIDHNELIVVQTCQLLNDEHNILLTHHSGDNSDSPDSIDLNNHDLITHVFSNQSFKTGETIFVDSNIHSMCDPQFTEDNLNLMKQHQLSEPFRFQCVNVRDENSGNDIGPLVSNEFQIKCNQQQYDLNDIMEYAEKEIRGNISPTVDSQLNKVQLHNDFNKEINPEMDAFKYEDNNSDHSLFVDEQFYNASVPNLLTDQQVNGFKIEKVESLAYLSSTKDSVCDNISGGSCEQNSEFEAHHDTYKCTICLAVFTDEDVLNSHKKETHASVDNPKEPINGTEHVANVRRLRMKNACPYCLQGVLHFARHLQRKHKGEVVVKELLSLAVRDPQRKKLLDIIRKQGNYLFNSQSNVVRPVRRSNYIHGGKEDVENYIACQNCLGFFKKKFLGRHRKTCALRPKNHEHKRENHLTGSQMFTICAGEYREFYDSLQLKNKVFNIMRADEISRNAMKDVLICSYAESLLFKHKHIKIRTTISNKMRELGRLLTELTQMTGLQRLFDILKAEFFEDIISATKIISGYDVETRTFKASSLALHMGPTLKQVCDIASKMIIERNRFLPCDDEQQSLENIEGLRNLIKDHWNSKVSSLTLKNLNETQCGKPKLFSLTSDLINFQHYVMKEAKEACDNIIKRNEIKKEYRRLSENVLALTLLFNRKRIGEIQYLKFKTYNAETFSNQQEEFLKSLSESEKLLTRSFKKIITGGKGSKAVVILFPRSIQQFINVMLSVRNKCVPDTNEYMFADPNTENRWLNGQRVLKKIAGLSNINNQDLFSPTRLRKQIATMLQVMNMTDTETEQFAAFMGHTEKTHVYRLPGDVYQTAKISKLLLAINKGKGTKYEGKPLDEMEFSDNMDTDESDSDTVLDIRSAEVEPRKGTRNTLRQIGGTSCYSQINIHRERNMYSEGSGNIEESTLDKKNTKPKTKRNRWTEEQKLVITDYFKAHIENKKPPRKKETEEFIETYKELFKEMHWADPILEESDKQVTSDRVQKYFLENLGEYKEDGEKQIHTKLRDFCIFCKSYVLNFARHILRKHSIEKEVQKIISLSPKNKSRRRLFSELKKRGNFFIRKPMRRLRTGVNILPCTNCMGYYSAKRLWHHRKACMGKSDKLHQVKAQDLLLKDLRVDKQLKDKVFLRMRPDVISMKAKTDELICEFGARYFKGHREKYSVNVTSRKMRELARLLIEIQKLKPSVKNLYEALRPEHFEILISATKIVAQYNEKNESFKSASTALNLGTAIKQCCRIAIVFVHKKKQVDSTFSVVEPEADLKTLIQLIDREWSLKISTRAINDLNMKKWTKVTMVPLLDDLKIIKECLILKATTAVNQLQINCEDKNAYVTLLETVFCRVLLLNRRQPRELQRLHLDMYEQSEEDSKNYEEFSDIITTSEKILLQRFKRVFIRSKKGHRVPILFSLDIQEHIDILLRYRENFVNKNNVYLFGNPSSIQPICGYEIINKYAKLSGAKNPQAILAISEYDMEQLSTFIDSSIIVQRGSYYLPDDIFQTAKILMLLLLMEKHEATQYKDKNLDKVNIDLDIDHHDVNDNGGVEFQPLSKTSKVISIHSLPGTSQADSMPQLPLNASCFLSRPRQSRILVPWTDEQKETVRQFFATHIKKHMPPKKHECVILKNKYTTLLENKNWLKIKVFVQNEYTKRKRWKNN